MKTRSKIFAGGIGLIGGLRSGLETNSAAPAKNSVSVESSTATGTDAAGSIAVTVAEHTVEAKVHGSLNSQSDISVEANIEQKAVLASKAESTRNAVDETSNTKNEISAAIGVSVYANSAVAELAHGATTDAAGETSVASNVEYPIRTGNDVSATSLYQAFGPSGPAVVSSMLDGTLGLSRLFNVSGSSLAQGERAQLALGGGVIFNDYTNNVVARIGNGASVNQSQAFDRAAQSVNVDSTFEFTSIDVGQMSALNLSLPGAAEAYLNSIQQSDDRAGTSEDFLGQLGTPFGVSGKTGIGGMLLLTLADNTTTAEIARDAMVSAGLDGISVIADSDFFNVAVVQTGTASTDFGFSAAITASNIKSSTTARILESARVDAGALTVRSRDNLDRINVAGSFLKGKQIGVGTSVGVNVIDQNVASYVGRDDSDPTIKPTGSIEVSGTIDVTAKADGQVRTLVMSGLAHGLSENHADKNKGTTTKTNTSTKQTGAIALSVPVSVNSVDTTVEAYIDSVSANAQSARITSESSMQVHGAVVGASFALQANAGNGSSKLDLAGAGAVAINNVNQDVAAFVKDSNYIGAGDLIVTATDRSTAKADGGGFGIALVRSNGSGVAPSFGVSVAINDVTGETRAYIDHSDITLLSGKFDMDAISRSRVEALSLAGAAAVRASNRGVSGSFGAAGAGSRNSVERVVSSELRDSAVVAQSGDVEVRAAEFAQTIADTGGLGVGINAGGGNKVAGALGVGVAMNDTAFTTQTIIDASAVTARNGKVDASAFAGGKIEASSLAATVGVAGGAGLSGGLSGSGSGAKNETNNNVYVEARNGSDISTENGDLLLSTDDRTKINSTAIGASLGGTVSTAAGGSLAIGVSVAQNEIRNNIHSAVENSTLSVVDAHSLIVNARDLIDVDANAIAASVSLSATVSPGISLSGGGAEATNFVAIDVDATVTGSTLAGDPSSQITSVAANQVDAYVFGVYGAAGGSAATGGAASIGAGVANNYMGYDSNGNKVESGATTNVVNSDLQGRFEILVMAHSFERVHSEILVGSLAIFASGGAAGSVTGSGGSAQNFVATTTAALVDGDNQHTVQTSNFYVSAADDSQITADVTSAAIGAVFSGGSAGTLAVGLALAENEVSNTVDASIRELDYSSGTMTVLATQDATIESNSTAAALGISVTGGLSGAVSGGGAHALNKIANKTIAFVEDSTLTGGIVVEATNTSDINATIHAIATSGAIGGTSVGGAIGVALAENRIGDLESTDLLGELSEHTRAYITNTNIVGAFDVDVRAETQSSIDANILGGAFAASFGATAGSAAGSGGSVRNVVASHVNAIIEGSDDTTISTVSFASPGDVAVTAFDNTTVNATVSSITVAGAAGPSAGSISIGVSEANTEIANVVEASVRDATITTEGSLNVEAIESATINSNAYATAAGAALGFGGAISGGGAFAWGEVNSQVDASIVDSEFTVAENVSINAVMTPTSDVRTRATSIAGGLIGLAGSGSVAKSVVTPKTNSLLRSDMFSVGGNVLVSASTDPHADANAGGLTVSTGLAVGVSKADVELGGSTTATLDVPSAEQVHVGGETISVNAHVVPSNLSTAKAQGSAGGLLLGTDSTITGVSNQMSSHASIADGSSFSTDAPVTVSSRTDAIQEAEASSLALGLIAAGVTKATATTGTSSTASVGDNANVTTGGLTVNAHGDDRNHAHTTAGSGGAISGAAAIPTTAHNSNTKATIGSGSTDRQVSASVLDVNANHTATFDHSVIANSGGILSGAGGALLSVVAPTVEVVIANNANVTANEMRLHARNSVLKFTDRTHGNMDATTGGVIAGVGVDDRTVLSLNTDIRVGENAELVSTVGGIDMHTMNSIDANSELTLRSGGVAAGGILNTAIETVADVARITVGHGAVVRSVDEINMSARGTGEANIQANSESFGAATLGSGLANIDIRPQNEIIVQSNALLRGNRDVNLSSGTDTNFNRDTYNVESRIDSFAGSLLPLGTIDSTAFVIQTNRIDVAEGAKIETGGNLRIHAEQHGYNNVLARAKEVSWVSGLTSAIDGLFGEGGEEQFGGTAEASATGVVDIGGRLETGIHRKQILEIVDVERIESQPGQPESPNDYLIHIGEGSTGTIEWEQSLRAATSRLSQEIRYAEEQLRIYQDNATLKSFYEGELDRLYSQLEEQGLVDENGSRVERQTLVMSLRPVYASAGAIDIRASQLDGPQDFFAPGDVEVRITNDTEAHLEINGILIPQNNGGVRFNGEDMPTDSAADDARIVVRNTRNVTASDVTENGKYKYAWPGIDVIGAVTNLSGLVELRNLAGGAGGIDISAPVRGKTVRTIAGNHGSVAVELAGTDYEVGGAEHASIQSAVRNDGTQSLTASFFATQPIAGVVHGQSLFDWYMTETPTDIALYGNRVYISAEYINVRGIIQSGKESYNLSIGEDTAREIRALPKDATGQHPLSTLSDSDFLVEYDADQQRIIVSDFFSSGGYIDLTGHMVNTHNGEIRALSGYSNVNIDNRTSYDIELNRIDISEKGDGTIVIKDKAKGAAPDPATTTYKWQDDLLQVVTPTDERLLSKSATLDLQYVPRQGQRYGWTISEENLERTIRTYGSASYIGLDFLAKDHELVREEPPQPIGEPRILDAGAFYYSAKDGLDHGARCTVSLLGVRVPGPPQDDDDYNYCSETRQLSNRTTDGRSWTEPSGFLSLGETHYRTRVTETGTQTLHTHTLEADRPIDIEFLGHDEGVINVHSVGDVYLNGHLKNPNGEISISGSPQDAFSSVYSASNDGLIEGREIKVYLNGADSERGYIGTQESPVLVKLRDTPDASLHVTGTNVSVEETVGNLRIRTAYATEYLGLTAPGDIVATGMVKPDGHFRDVEIISDNVSLNSTHGSIGTLDKPIDFDLQTFSPVKLSAKAANDVIIRSATDLQVDSIEAGRDVRINLSDGRRILDANANAEVDDRAIDALRANVWDDLQLTDNGNGFELKFDERVAAFESNQTTNYHVYWSLRNSQDDSANYDPTHRVTLSESERFHFDDDLVKIDEEESRRTEGYHRLHPEQGGRTTSYDSGFRYTATSDEKSDIRNSMKQWTEDELVNTRSHAFLESSDTELTLEAPNIQGRFVSLNAHGGIGNYRDATHITLPINHNGVITLGEQATIDAAEPGDLIYLSTVPTKIEVSIASSYVFGKSWAEDGYAVGQSIYLEADEITGPPTYAIVDIDGSRMFLDRVPVENVVSAAVFIARVADDVDQATHLVVQRRDDIDVDARVAVRAESAAGDVFLGSESDIPLLSIIAGSPDNPGRVQIKAKGNVVDVNPDSSAHAILNIIGGQIEIESADGHVGVAGKPIRLHQLEGGSLTTRADDEVVIRNTNETKLGVLNVDQIFSRNSFVSLTADNSSIVDAFESDETNIKAHDIRIAACRNIGAAGNALDIDSAPNSMVTARSEHGTIYLHETNGNLNIESTPPRSVLAADGKVIDLSKRVIGDSNHDGIFDSSDLVAVFQADEYQDDIDGNSTWEEGDWNGDGDFTTSDLVAAFSAGTYQNPNPPTHPVEPAEAEELHCTVLSSGSDTIDDSLNDGNVLGNFDGESDAVDDMLGDSNVGIDGGAGDNVLNDGIVDSNLVDGDFHG